jgi:glycine dehydrogenase
MALYARQSCSKKSLPHIWSRSQYSSKTIGREVLEPLDTFPQRHLGSQKADIDSMLHQLKAKNIDELLGKAIPGSILSSKPLAIKKGVPERQLLERLREIASKNKVTRSFIGQGYTDTVVPNVILRNILENPAWYTQVSLTKKVQSLLFLKKKKKKKNQFTYI